MKKLLLGILILPVLSWADPSSVVPRTRVQDNSGTNKCYPWSVAYPDGSVTCNADGTASVSAASGGGGSSSLEIMANNVRVSSPTGTGKFNGTTNGIGINATVSGSTATLTFSLLPGNSNYMQNPATGTWSNNFGMGLSTMTVSSNTVLPGLTIYGNGNWVSNGLTFNYLGKSLSVATDIGGVLGSPFYGTHIKAFADTDIPVGLYGYAENTGATAPTIGHGMGIFGLVKDAATSRHPMYGIEGRTNAYGLNATEYAGILGLGTHIGPYNGILAGIIARGEITTDGTTPTSTGTYRGVWIKAPIGRGADNQTHALYSESPYPSYLTGKLGIGSGTSNPGANIYVNTEGNLFQGQLILSGQTTSYAFWQMGRASPDMSIAVAAAANQFFNGTNAGDTVIRAESSANTFHIGAGASGVAAFKVDNTSVTVTGNLTVSSNAVVAGTTFYPNGGGMAVNGNIQSNGVGPMIITAPAGLVFNSSVTFSTNTYLPGGTSYYANGLAVIKTLVEGTSTYANHFSSGTITPDGLTGNNFSITLTSNLTINIPTNAQDMQMFRYRFIQDAAGSRTITLGSGFAFGADVTSWSASTAANKVDYLGCIYNAAAGKCHVISSSLRGY